MRNKLKKALIDKFGYSENEAEKFISNAIRLAEEGKIGWKLGAIGAVAATFGWSVGIAVLIVYFLKELYNKK